MKNLSDIKDDPLIMIRRMLDQEALYWGKHPFDKAGMFIISSDVDKNPLRVIATSGNGWDHVAVSRVDRIPVWNEMEQIKRIFFKDDEVAFQFHPSVNNYVNFHPNCLHLFRSLEKEIPMPPQEMV